MEGGDRSGQPLRSRLPGSTFFAIISPTHSYSPDKGKGFSLGMVRNSRSNLRQPPDPGPPWGRKKSQGFAAGRGSGWGKGAGLGRQGDSLPAPSGRSDDGGTAITSSSFQTRLGGPAPATPPSSRPRPAFCGLGLLCSCCVTHATLPGSPGRRRCALPILFILGSRGTLFSTCQAQLAWHSLGSGTEHKGND